MDVAFRNSTAGNMLTFSYSHINYPDCICFSYVMWEKMILNKKVINVGS